MSAKPRRKKHRQAVGSVPGTLAAAPDAKDTEVSLISYAEGSSTNPKSTKSIESCFTWSAGVLWLNFEGLGDIDTLRSVGEICDIHRLALEDIIYNGASIIPSRLMQNSPVVSLVHYRPSESDRKSGIFPDMPRFRPNPEERNARRDTRSEFCISLLGYEKGAIPHVPPSRY